MSEITETAVAAVKNDPDYKARDLLTQDLLKGIAEETTGLAKAWLERKWTLSLLRSSLTAYADGEMKGQSGCVDGETVCGWNRHVVLDGEQTADAVALVKAPNEAKAEQKTEAEPKEEEPKKEKPAKKAKQPEGGFFQGDLFAEMAEAQSDGKNEKAEGK